MTATTTQELESSATEGLYHVVDDEGRQITELRESLYDISTDVFYHHVKARLIARVRPATWPFPSGVWKFLTRPDGMEVIYDWEPLQ